MLANNKLFPCAVAHLKWNTREVNNGHFVIENVCQKSTFKPN